MGHGGYHSATRRGTTTRRRRWHGYLVVLAVVMVTAACGDGSKPAQSHATGSAPPTVPAPTTSASPEQATGAADLAEADVTLSTVASGLNTPTQVLWRPGDPRMYVAELGGAVRIIDESGRPLGKPVLTVPAVDDPVRGLFSVVFSPDGSKVYAQYNRSNGDLQVDEFTMDGDVARDGRKLFALHEPYPDHNGGGMVLGPDGMLYIGLGDGSGTGDPLGNAQELGTLLGKILRISPDAVGRAPYAVPADNPFVGRDGARSEIWMYGLRNPWRFSFDRDGTMWIGDSGQDDYDEIDEATPEQAAGANWGWNLREGRHKFKGARPRGALDPVIELPHAGTTNCSVMAGYVYRGAAIPALQGAFLHSDACNPDLVATVVENGKVREERVLGQVRGVTSFGQDPDGEVYVVSRTGTVVRLDPAAS